MGRRDPSGAGESPASGASSVGKERNGECEVKQREGSMRERIFKYLSEREESVSFAELAENVDGFKGRKGARFALEIGRTNVHLWHDMSLEAVEAMNALRRAKVIEVRPAKSLPGRYEHVCPQWPVAKQARHYRKPVWVPAVIRLKGVRANEQHQEAA